MNEQELLTEGLCDVREAARFLAVSRSLIYGLMNAGKLPWCKIGRARRLPRAALVRFAAEALRGGQDAEAERLAAEWRRA